MRNTTAQLFTLHVHASGSAGTSMCALARHQRGAKTPPYNCLMRCKGPADWLPVALDHECRSARSCDGLLAMTMEFPIGRLTFGEVETLAPNWFGCSGVRYTLLMAEPVHRVLVQAHRHCSRGPRISSICDPAELLRRWYGLERMLVPWPRLPPWANGSLAAGTLFRGPRRDEDVDTGQARLTA